MSGGDPRSSAAQIRKRAEGSRTHEWLQFDTVRGSNPRSSAARRPSPEQAGTAVAGAAATPARIRIVTSRARQAKR